MSKGRVPEKGSRVCLSLPKLLLLGVIRLDLEFFKRAERLKEFLLPLLFLGRVIVEDGTPLFNLGNLFVFVPWRGVGALELEARHAAPLYGCEHRPCGFTEDGWVLEVLLLPLLVLQVQHGIEEAVGHGGGPAILLLLIRCWLARFELHLGQSPGRGFGVAEQDERDTSLLRRVRELLLGLWVRAGTVTLDPYVFAVHYQRFGVGPRLHHHFATATHCPVPCHDGAKFLRHPGNSRPIVLLRFAP